jgi:hypothetical protein
MTTAILRKTLALVAGGALAASAIGCSSTVREGRSPAYLIIDSLEAAPGADSTSFTNDLASDVQTTGSALQDPGQVTFTLGLKDVGTPGNSTSPTTNNFITLTRYHVSFRRADGRNTPGIDVPYAFDGAFTGTVNDSTQTFTFVLVRIQAKLESPLVNLIGRGGAQAILTIADVTFYGKDQTGNDVAVTGSLTVNFADWADPQ